MTKKRLFDWKWKMSIPGTHNNGCLRLQNKNNYVACLVPLCSTGDLLCEKMVPLLPKKSSLNSMEREVCQVKIGNTFFSAISRCIKNWFCFIVKLMIGRRDWGMFFGDHPTFWHFLTDGISKHVVVHAVWVQINRIFNPDRSFIRLHSCVMRFDCVILWTQNMTDLWHHFLYFAWMTVAIPNMKIILLNYNIYSWAK